MTSTIRRAAEYVASVRWDDLTPEVQERTLYIVLDTLGCAFAGQALDAGHDFVATIVNAGGEATANRWVHGGRLPSPHAALINGLVAHHVEMDDGNPRASLHGGTTIVPAAFAMAEEAGSTGQEFLAAIAAGYGAAIAMGRPLLPGITEHRLHPPAMTGCFGAAAVAAKLLGLDVQGIAAALSITATLIPVAPFESFTKGAPVKDLYGGWPAYLGVVAALLARDGLAGPEDLYEAERDGIGSFLNHGPYENTPDADPAEVLFNQFKAYATCKSVQPSLTALEALLPVEASSIDSIHVETYPYAVGLSEDSDPRSAIGAKTSIPYGLASYILDGMVWPDSFSAERLNDPHRQALASRISVEIAPEYAEPVKRASRLTVRMTDGTVQTSETGKARWVTDAPPTYDEIIAKFRRLAGGASDPVLQAVMALPTAPNLATLIAAVTP